MKTLAAECDHLGCATDQCAIKDQVIPPMASALSAYPRAQLDEDERAMLAMTLRQLVTAIRDTFDGVGAVLNVPVGPGVTSRMVLAVLREARDAGWHANMAIMTSTSPPLVAGGRARIEFVSFVITVAVNADAADVMRVRRETAQ